MSNKILMKNNPNMTKLSANHRSLKGRKSSFISPELLNQIRDRQNMAELVARYTAITPQGKALCCFHSEKTASMRVNLEKKLFHCFGCGIGGDIYTFIMMTEKLTFLEAVTQLANECGISLPSKTSGNKSKRNLGLLKRKLGWLEYLGRKKNAAEDHERLNLRNMWLQLPASRLDWSARDYTRELWIHGRFDEIDEERRKRDEAINEAKGVIRNEEHESANK